MVASGNEEITLFDAKEGKKHMEGRLIWWRILSLFTNLFALAFCCLVPLLCTLYGRFLQQKSAFINLGLNIFLRPLFYLQKCHK